MHDREGPSSNPADSPRCAQSGSGLVSTGAISRPALTSSGRRSSERKSRESSPRRANWCRYCGAARCCCRCSLRTSESAKRWRGRWCNVPVFALPSALHRAHAHTRQDRPVRQALGGVSTGADAGDLVHLQQQQQARQSQAGAGQSQRQTSASGSSSGGTMASMV